MIAYDGRIYRDKRIEPPFDDPEWDKAEKRMKNQNTIGLILVFIAIKIF